VSDSLLGMDSFGECAEKARPIIENEKQDPFSFYVFDSDD